MNMFKVLEKIGTGRTTGHYMYYIKIYTFCYVYIYNHSGVDRIECGNLPKKHQDGYIFERHIF